jgi:hypothetical protein
MNEDNRILPGDFFVHTRTGVKFVCRSITHHDYAGIDSPLRIEIEPAKPEALTVFNAEAVVDSYKEALGVPGRLIQ